MTTAETTDSNSPSTKIKPDDARYRAVLDKRFNKRFSARPDYVRLVSSNEQVQVAIEEAVSEGRRFVVTSGGHCLDGFVSDPDVRATNHPDTDLADAAWNTSGVPWSTLYYQDNYARLQRIKTQWDPMNVFRHVLSIRVR